MRLRYLAPAAFLVLSLVLSSCQSSSTTPTNSQVVSVPPALSDEEETYRVYDAFLRERAPTGIVIESDIGTGTLTEKYDRDPNLNGLSPEIVSCYDAASNRAAKLTPHGLLGSKSFPFADKKQAKRPNAKNYVPASLQFSGVGFNADKTRALISVAYLCGSTCGWVSYFFLARSADGWSVVWNQGEAVF